MSTPLRISMAPSAASRWTTCTASPRFLAENKHRLPQDADEFNEEGVEAHKLAAQELLIGVDQEECQDLEMLVHVKNYAKFVRKQSATLTERDGHVDIYIEQPVNIWFYPGRTGYVDHGIVSPKHIYITDLKYGVGVQVYARGNKQLAIYGKSWVEELRLVQDVPDDTLVTLCIYQPRGRVVHPSGEPISLWNLTVKELYDFCDQEIQSPMEEIRWEWDNPEDYYANGGSLQFQVSDEACKFCPARKAGICKAYANEMLGGVPVVGDEDITLFDALENTPAAKTLLEADKTDEALLGDEPDPYTYLAKGVVLLPSAQNLSPEIRARLVRNMNRIKNWLDKMEEFCYNEMQAGRKDSVPGGKLVLAKAGNRNWADPEKAARFLARHLSADERFVRSVISPAEAEKRLKAKKVELTTRWENGFNNLITRKAAGLTLVFEDDPREEHLVQEELEFENLDDLSLLD